MKNKFSAEEKKSYYMGLGAALGHATQKGIKKTMDGMTPKMKTSYLNGIDDGLKRNLKFQKIKKGR